MLMLNNKVSYNTPLLLTTLPKTPLIADIQGLNSKLNLSNTFNNESYLTLLNLFNNNKSFYFDNYLQKIKNKNNINFMYKMQYLPMRKGISNMIRLHATGAIALPIETRLQILASSKDVIHS
jgi:hypothetical protein